jgi:hypothetical protein
MKFPSGVLVESLTRREQAILLALAELQSALGEERFAQLSQESQSTYASDVGNVVYKGHKTPPAWGQSHAGETS